MKQKLIMHKRFSTEELTHVSSSMYLISVKAFLWRTSRNCARKVLLRDRPGFKWKTCRDTIQYSSDTFLCGCFHDDADRIWHPSPSTTTSSDSQRAGLWQWQWSGNTDSCQDFRFYCSKCTEILHSTPKYILILLWEILMWTVLGCVKWGWGKFHFSFRNVKLLD